MKQVLQNLASGETALMEVPCPQLQDGSVLIASRNTLVSPGTERMLIDFGKANFFKKAIQQPDKVRQVLGKVKTDGIMPTYEAVRSKLEQLLPLGYCNSGIVIESRSDLFQPGDRVISNGGHAEVVAVPQNLCARIPQNVNYESASFTVLGAISLQSVRLASPTLGETVVVIGLGLIGLMTVQMLLANGCRVIGIDRDSLRCGLARQYGADAADLSKGEDSLSIVDDLSRGRGADAVIVAASSDGSEIIHEAATMCRQRGRIVLVGAVGLKLRRDDFYKKEITFQVSCSYGPGRYDPSYEERGNDYPLGLVRWTEQRNFEAVLDMMSRGRLDVQPLISHRFFFDDAVEAYELLGSDTPSLGVLLSYSERQIRSDSSFVEIYDRETPKSTSCRDEKTSIRTSFIGSGNYASRVLIPAFHEAGSTMCSLASNSGVSSVSIGHKFGFRRLTTDCQGLINDENIDAVVIATRHDSHARFVRDSLDAGKHVFVEKPLCLDLEELADIEATYKAQPINSLLMIGFNRRFSPHIQKIKTLLSHVSGPKSFVMIVNAGSVSDDHWTLDHTVGGGRIIGEACHFIDLLRFLAGSSITNASINSMAASSRDTVSINLNFDDGSIGTIHYFANGSNQVSKERLEIFAQGRVLQLDNYRRLVGFGWPGFKKMNSWRQDKGQRNCVRAFVDAIKFGSPAPIRSEEIFEVSRVAINLARG